MLLKSKYALVSSCFLCLISASVAPLAALSQPAPQSQAPRRMSDAEIVRDLRWHMERLVLEDRFSGTVLFARHGRPLFEQAYGSADRAFDAKNQVDTKFNLASMAKLFTATAILQLAGEGKLSLDAPLSAVLPDYPNQAVAGKITIRHLLMHRSGLGDYVGNKWYQVNPSTFRRIRDYLQFFVNDPLLFEPGTQYAYSNAGALVLGLVVENLSGQPFEEYVRDHIFEPAEMSASGYYSSEDDIPNVALGYTSLSIEADAPLKVALRLGRGAGAAGGTGTYTTVEDLLRFARAVKTGALLNQQYTDALMKSDSTQHRHLYGWMQEYVNGVHITGHGGSTMGTSTSFEIYPDLGYTVAVLANYDGAARLVAGRLKSRLTGQRAPRAVHLPAEVLQQFEGRYASSRGPGGMMPPPIHITVDGGSLFATIALQGKHKFAPLADGEFFDEDMLSGRLTFTKDASGKVNGLTMTGISPESITASRLP